MKCQHCGAVLAASALQCSFCQAPTAAAVRAREQQEHAERQRAHWAAAQQHQERVAAQGRLHSLSTHAMWWSIGGTLICCLPVAVLGLVQGMRARGLARTLGVPLPFGAVLGLVLGILGALLSVGGFTWAIISSNEDKAIAAARIRVLEDKAKDGSQSTTLIPETACALAEAHALKTGFDGHSGPTLRDFECLGAIHADGDRAELDAYRFSHLSTRYDLTVCFKRGARWYVDQMKEGRCGADATAPAASTSAGPRGPAAPMGPSTPKRR